MRGKRQYCDVGREIEDSARRAYHFVNGKRGRSPFGDRDDAVQETFEILLERYGSLENVAALDPCERESQIKKAAGTAASRSWGKGRRPCRQCWKPDVPDETWPPEYRAIVRDLTEHVLEQLDKLDFPESAVLRVIILRAMCGLNVADALDLVRQTTRERLSRATYFSLAPRVKDCVARALHGGHHA